MKIERQQVSVYDYGYSIDELNKKYNNAVSLTILPCPYNKNERGETTQLLIYAVYGNDESRPIEQQVSRENGDPIDAFKWALQKMEVATDRFIANEKFLMELQSSFWKWLFAKHYIQKHLEEILSHFSG